MSLPRTSLRTEEHAAASIPSPIVTIAVDGTECTVYPSRASLRIEGSFARRDGSVYPARDLHKLVDRIMFGFDEAKYTLDGKVIETVPLPGVCVSHRRATAHRCGECSFAATCGPAFPDRDHIAPRARTNGSFVCNLPMDLIFGFCEDHVGPVSGHAHEIVLVRGADSAVIAAAGVERGTMTIDNISLLMPRIEGTDPCRSKATFRSKQVHSHDRHQRRMRDHGVLEWLIDARQAVDGLTLAFNCTAGIEKISVNGRAPTTCSTQVMPYPGNTVFPFAETDSAITVRAEFDNELFDSVAYAVSRHPVQLLV